MTSKNIGRCIILAFAVTFIVAMIPAMADAQVIQHGIAASKGCLQTRVCDDDLDCDDGLECTDDVCDTTFDNITHCEVQVEYNDDAGDTIQIDGITDTLTTSGGPVVTVNPPIEVVGGNTTCVVGAFAPCFIGPAGSTNNGLPGTAADGTITVHIEAYNPVPADLPGPLPDTAQVTVTDQCDGTPDPGCPTAPITANPNSQTVLADACSNPPVPASTPCTDEDGNECTEAGCDGAGACDQLHITPDSTPCGDGQLDTECSTAGCDGAGTCDPLHTLVPASTPCTDDDGNECTEAGCDGAGTCDQNHILPDSTPCGDGQLDTECATAGCDGAGTCDPLHTLVEASTPCTDDDGNECTEAGCDGAGACDQLHITPESTPCGDGQLDTECAAAGCDGAGTCDPLHIPVEASTPCTDDDGNECTDAGCDGAGACDQDHILVEASTPCTDTDGIECTEAGCDGAGTCDQGHITECVTEICRTPGFWATHAGDECPPNKPDCGSQNITQAVIDWAGCLNVCGEAITSTDVDAATSAIEAMCVSVKGDSLLQLVRQLTATALNCVESGGGSDCDNISIEGVFQECNALCAADGIDDGLTVQMCIDQLDCFNNGGVWFGDMCWYGICEAGDTGALCNVDTDCDIVVGDLFIPGVCGPNPASCHAQELCNPDIPDLCFEPTGPAGSEKLCNGKDSAHKSDCAVIQPYEDDCASNDPDTCFPFPVTPECEGATCGNFIPCSEPDSCASPVCATTAEGPGICVDGATPCAGLAPCTTSADCGPGEACAVETCCVDPVCVPASAFCVVDGATSAPVTATEGGATIGQ